MYQRMFEVAVTVTKVVDDGFPAVVRCELRDVHGKMWMFDEKWPVVSADDADPSLVFPTAAVIRCQVGERSVNPDGKRVVQIDTAYPDHVVSLEGTSTFEVFAHQVSSADG